MMEKHPDLFDWQPPAPSDGAPSASVVAFPLDRDIGRVRHVARLLIARTSEKARASYWRVSVCNSIAKAMRGNGFTDAEITRQLEAFSAAVSREMARVTNGERRQG